MLLADEALVVTDGLVGKVGVTVTAGSTECAVGGEGVWLSKSVHGKWSIAARVDGCGEDGVLVAIGRPRPMESDLAPGGKGNAVGAGGVGSTPEGIGEGDAKEED